MLKNRVAQIAAVVFALALTGSAAQATVHILYPVTGAAFSANGLANPNLGHGSGVVYNNSTSASLTVEASLGKTTGGMNSVIVYFQNNGGTLTCQLFVRNMTNGSVTSSTPVSKTTNGFDNITLSANPVGSDFFYTVQCTVPPVSGGIFSSIFGAKPTT